MRDVVEPIKGCLAMAIALSTKKVNDTINMYKRNFQEGTYDLAKFSKTDFKVFNRYINNIERLYND